MDFEVAPQVARENIQLNVHNIHTLKQNPPAHFEAVRFDPNNNCNLRCVYCHNDRSSETIDMEEFRSFLDNNILSMVDFQVGCIMEPTMDRRMCDLMLMVANSAAKPSRSMILQTNGVLLNRHDYGKMRDAGLSELSVSVDAASAETHKTLRGGTSLDTVVSNLKAFKKTCPDTLVTFISTVTSINVGDLGALVQQGLDLGVKKFVFREMFYYPESSIVDHGKMLALLLKGNEFSRMKQGILDRFANQACFVFADNATLEKNTEEIKAASKR